MENIKLFDVNEAQWRIFKDGMRYCIFKPSKSSTVQYSEIQPEVVVDSHSHPEEQIVYIQEGFVDTTVDGKTYFMMPGCFCYIPSGAEHSVVNRGNSTCIVIDIFLPERADKQASEKGKDMKHNW